MPTFVKTILAGGLLLALGACSKFGGEGPDQMAWAKDALERNDRIEVVASDPQAKTFTVRVKDSGQLVVLPVDQVIAGPAALLSASGQQASVMPTNKTGEAPAPPPPPPAPETSVPEAAPPPVAPAHSETALPGPSQQNSNPPVASSGEAAEPAQPTESVKGPRAAAAAHASPGSVLAEGPGYSIKASGPKSVAVAASPSAAPRGAPERLHDPIICQGDRLL